MEQKKESKTTRSKTKHVRLTHGLIQVLKNSNGLEVAQAHAEKEKAEVEANAGKQLVRRKVRGGWIEYWV